MARPVEIDREQAFEIAFQLFWERGYRATSLQQLLDKMDIGKSSFYAAFTSKEALFADALTYYWAQTRLIFQQIREAHQGLAGIREFLNVTLLNISDEERGRGCLAVNSILELAGVDDVLHARASQLLSDIQFELESILQQAQSLGELREDQSPRELAQLLIFMLQGLRVSSRRGMSRQQSRAAIESLMRLLA